MFVFKNIWIGIPFALSLLLLVIGGALAWRGLRGAEDLLVIHFDSFRGIDFLGTKKDVAAILQIGGVFLVLNALLSSFFYRRIPFLSYLLAYVSLVVCILILIGVGVILNFNL